MTAVRGKRALVTGAAGGLGRALSCALAREGAELLLVDRDAEGLARVVDEARALGAAAEARQADLAGPEAVAELADEVLAHPRRVQLLVNNAGLLHRGDLRKTPIEAAERLLAVNLLAPVRLTQRLLPALLERRHGEERGGHVVNLCSLAGLLAVRQLGIYSVSKFGLVGYSEALRSELGHRLGVTAVCPGLVDTPMFTSSVGDAAREARLRRLPFLLTSAERVAERSVRAIRRNRALLVISPLARALWLAKRIYPPLLRRG